MTVQKTEAGVSGSSPGSSILIVCRQCGRSSEGEFFQACPNCRGDIRFHYPNAAMKLPLAPRSMWDFADRLPVQNRGNIISLGEGLTPLLGARSFPDRPIFWKNEGANPTGSQKDRAISVAISVAREHHFERVVTASTGSVGLSCAAYCARAQLPCLVLVPKGTPVERLRPMIVLGAKVILAESTFEEIEQMLARLDPVRWYQASTIQRRNCYQSEGPKTIAYEIVLQLGQAPDWVVVPIGGGGTLFGLWKGFDELVHAGLIERLPKFLGVQNRAFNFLERVGIRPEIDETNFADIIPDERVVTITRNLKHGFPPDAHNAMHALHASGGQIISVTDEDALAAQRSLASQEGIFCEPSAAVGLAAIARATKEGWIASDECAVGIITGSGFREQTVLSDLEPIRVDTISEDLLEQLITDRD